MQNKLSHNKVYIRLIRTKLDKTVLQQYETKLYLHKHKKTPKTLSPKTASSFFTQVPLATTLP